jgi:hypothetical protein
VYESWGIGGEETLFEARTVPFAHLSAARRNCLEVHWQRLCDLKLASRTAIAVVVVTVAYVHVAIYQVCGVHAIVPSSVLATFAGPGGTRWISVSLCAVVAIFANDAAFGLFFTLEHLRFVSEFIEDEQSVVRTNRSISVKHLYLSRRPLEELSVASFLSSIAWFGGMAILALVSVVAPNSLTILVLIGLIEVGLYIFVRPQWAVLTPIRTAKSSAIAQVESSLPKDWYDPGKGVPTADQLPVLGMLHDLAATSEWHIDVRLVLFQAITAVLPFLAAFVGGPPRTRLT